MARITSNDLGQLTEKDYKMIEEASKKPITYDEDCPELAGSEIVKEMLKINNKKLRNNHISADSFCSDINFGRLRKSTKEIDETGGGIHEIF